MNKEDHLFIFYILLTLFIGIGTYIYTIGKDKMEYGLGGLVTGAILSYILWNTYGIHYASSK